MKRAPAPERNRAKSVAARWSMTDREVRRIASRWKKRCFDILSEKKLRPAKLRPIKNRPYVRMDRDFWLSMDFHMRDGRFERSKWERLIDMHLRRISSVPPAERLRRATADEIEQMAVSMVHERMQDL